MEDFCRQLGFLVILGARAFDEACRKRMSERALSRVDNIF